MARLPSAVVAQGLREGRRRRPQARSGRGQRGLIDANQAADAARAVATPGCTDPRAARAQKPSRDFGRPGVIVFCMITRLLAFEVTPDQAGGFRARCAQSGLVTRGETVEALRAKVREAVAGHFGDQPADYEVGLTLRLAGGHTERAVERVRVEPC